ncbi:D-alanyl-D-alanine carboxypeptidase/D-alanyl-D-alanine-endopeptidase [Streptomyces sp. NPDC057638]|uniref:D-alanyl-D-alanine carboxypeptidase/D-alanyl-D-alanine endopeptidase n=1 Tax=Streptomyces sp. NPDC057638 TaxID=3346190 RepID=UPI003688BEF6
MPVIRTWQLTAGATALGAVLATLAVTLAGPWEGGQRAAERQWAAARDGGAHEGRDAKPRADAPAPAPSAPGVLTALGVRAATATADDKAGPALLARELAPLLAAPGLGSLRTASVVDLTSGRALYGSGPAVAVTPASTVKIATAVAALHALGPDHRIATTTSLAPGGRLTLVGGGDASLTSAGLGQLADRTAAALKGRKVSSVRLAYDASRYRGPVSHPIGRNGNLAPVTALMVDGGRVAAGPPPANGYAERGQDPAGDAGRAFARLLSARGIAVAGPAVAGRPPAGARPLAQVVSAPLSDLVERTLTRSDNDLAEALARQTALASGEEASFAGGERAVRKRLATLGLPLTGARFPDGSGLDRRARLSAGLLTGLLSRAAEPDRPGLRPVLTGLPIAGFTGTLSERHTGSAPGAGVIRAKTGTLTGVNALAGTVVAADGRLLGFAFLAGKTTDRDAAQKALDALAAALAS